MATEKATFAAGCFWQVEEAFRHLSGVVSTAAGFIGGTMRNPSYEDVCTGRTGHAEAVQVEFEPAKVSYEKLLDVFWKSHDPKQKGRQGSDIGTQYRSAIFYHSEKQKEAAIKSKEKLQEKLKGKIATAIEKAATFYRAEEYHQLYLEKQGKTSCRI